MKMEITLENGIVTLHVSRLEKSIVVLALRLEEDSLDDLSFFTEFKKLEQEYRVIESCLETLKSSVNVFQITEECLENG